MNLSPNKTRAYLESNGWRLVNKLPSGAEVWFKSARSKNVYLPPEGDGWTHEDARRACSRIAIEERRPPEAVEGDIEAVEVES